MRLTIDIPNIFKVRWSRHAARGGVTFAFSYVHLGGYIKLYLRFITDRFQYVIAEGKGHEWLMWRNEEDVERLRRNLAEKTKKIDYVHSAFEKIKSSMVEYRQFGDKLKKIDFSKLTNRQLANIYIKHLGNTPKGTCAASTLIELIAAWGMKIESELEKQLKDEKRRKEMIMLLSSPSKITLPLEEELNFLRLISKIGRKSLVSLPPNLLAQVKKHFKKYCWLSVYFDEEPWSWDEFRKRIKEAQGKGGTKRKILRLLKERQKTERDSRLAIQKFNLNKKEISLLKEMMYYRIQIENFYSYVNYYAHDLKKEVASRIFLSQNQLPFLLPQEIELALSSKRVDPEAKIAERGKYYLMILGKKKVHLFTAQKARKIFPLLPKQAEKREKIKKIKGVCGYPGKVKEKIRVISKIEDLNKIKNKEILVAQNTTPVYVPAMKKAGAIVTDEGGITCHAAIVSRELGIPCVIGTKIATRVLKDGDLVEVDAKKGVVRKI